MDLLKNLKKKVLASKLLKDNLTLLIGTTILNILGFLFHFYVARKLGPEAYGVLGAILAILYIITIVLNTVQTSLTKFFSNLHTLGSYAKLRGLFTRSNKRLAVYGVILTLVFVAISPLLASFLNMSVTPILILSILIVFSLTLPIVRALLQGTQKFKNLSLNLVIEGIVKFSFVVIFIAIGWGLNGAVFAMVCSYIIAYVFGLFQTRKYIKKPHEEINKSLIYRDTWPVFLTLLLITSLYSLDTLLVKHFFLDLEAGYYASISLIGKILFFGTLSISQVMFPKLVEHTSQNKLPKKVFFNSLFLIGSIIFASLIIFFLIPKFIVGIAFGSEFLPAAYLIGPFGVFMALIALTFLTCLYFISLNKTKFLWILVIANILEVVLIYLFHNSLLQVLTIVITIIFIVFVILLTQVIFKKNEIINNSSSL
jgi:O-antigen/teichoic acid export membrane protein